MFNPRVKKILIPGEQNIDLGSDCRAENGAIHYVSNLSLVSFLHLWHRYNIQYSKSQGQKLLQRFDPLREFAVKYPAKLINILFANDSLIGM